MSDVATQRCHVFVHGQHFTDASRTARECFQRPRTQGIDAHSRRTEIVSQVPRRGIEGGFANAHHVVARHTFLSTEIRHARNRRTLGENGSSGIGDRDQAITADFHRQVETRAAGFNGIAPEIGSVGKRDGMQQEIDRSKRLLGRFHDFGYLDIVLHVQWYEEFRLAAGRRFFKTLFNTAPIFLFVVVGAVG